MSRIIMETSSSDIAVEVVGNILRGGFTAKTARISCNINKGLPLPEDINNYPLILKGKLVDESIITIHVNAVTAGYVGKASRAMVMILKAAGFKFEESDIITDMFADPTGQIDLTYTR